MSAKSSSAGNVRGFVVEDDEDKEAIMAEEAVGGGLAEGSPWVAVMAGRLRGVDGKATKLLGCGGLAVQEEIMAAGEVAGPSGW